MPDSTRPTLRLRLPASLPAEPRRPAGPSSPIMPGPHARPAAYVAPRRTGPMPLEPTSRAILTELAALGLADSEEG